MHSRYIGQAQYLQLGKEIETGDREGMHMVLNAYAAGYMESAVVVAAGAVACVGALGG